MLMVISPAKDLDFETPAATAVYSQPELLPEAQQLIHICRQLSPMQLSQLMHISDKLAGLNAARFSEWSLPFTADNAKAALYAFNGDVYQGLQAGSLSTAVVQYAQQHLRILSGLYGVLRPLDLMQPYRLEMGTALATPAGKGLYSYWNSKITAQLNQQLEHTGADYLLNLASIEYFKAVQPKQLNRPVIDVQFKDQKNGDYKVISFFAKKARGCMARYVLEQQVTTIDQLKDFAGEGYQYSTAASNSHKLVFVRSAAALEQYRLDAAVK